MKDGATLREHFASYRRQARKRHPKDVESCPIPESLAYLWAYFWDLNAGRPVWQGGFRPILDIIRHIQGEQAQAMRFIELAEVPAMILSYEKFLAAPAAFIRAVAVFSGVRPDDEIVSRAVLAVEPGNALYRETFAGQAA